MVRVSGFQQQVDAGITELTPDGLTPAQQLAVIRAARRPACWPTRRRCSRTT